MDEHIKCQVCGDVIPDPTLGDHATNDLQFAPGSGIAICSESCQVKAIRLNAVHKVVRFLKNCGYKEFQEVFSFPENGSYADNKFRLAKSSPWLFMCSLDNTNLLKLANCNQKE